MISEALYTSKTDEWATPMGIYEELDAEFGFDLDPCSTDENHKCAVYYTAAEDGLKQQWGGGIGYFVTHLIQRSASGLRKHLGRVGMTIR